MLVYHTIAVVVNQLFIFVNALILFLSCKLLNPVNLQIHKLQAHALI